MPLNVIMNECFQTISKTKQRKPKESPESGPRTRVKPTNKLPLTNDTRCSETLDQAMWIG